MLLAAVLMLFSCTPSPDADSGDDQEGTEVPSGLPEIPSDIIQEKPVLNIPAWLWDHSWQYEAPNTGNTITIEGLGESDFSITSNTAHYAIGSIAEAIAGKGKIVSEAIADDERGYELSYILYSRTDSEYTEETVDIVMEYTPSADEGIEESLHASYKSFRRIVASSGQVTTTGGNGFSFTFRSL